MKDGFAKKIELFANIALIIVALTLTGVLVKKFVFNEPAMATAPKETIAVGGRVNLPEINWNKNERTLVLVISTDCHFCHESLPFYQQLGREVAQAGNAQLIAVFPQDTATAEAYLESNNVVVAGVRQANPPSLGVGGTPTLLLVDRNGVVAETWFGKLVADQEKQVFERLRGADGSKSAG